MKQIRQLQIILNKNPLYVKYNLFLIPLLTVLIGIAILFLVTIPQALRLSENNQAIEQLKQKKVTYQDEITLLNKVDAVEYKTDLNNLLSILPNEKDIPSAINSILQVVSASGLTLTNFSIGSNGAPIAGVDNFGVSIELTGSQDQIKNFINSTDTSLRLIKITGISMNYGSSGTAQTSMDVLVFFAPLDTSIKQDSSQTISLLTSEDQSLLDKIQQIIGNNTFANSVNEPVQDGPTGKDDPFN